MTMNIDFSGLANCYSRVTCKIRAIVRRLELSFQTFSLCLEYVKLDISSCFVHVVNPSYFPVSVNNSVNK